MDRGSKTHPELGVIIRVAKVTDDSTLALAPALLWVGKDTIDETAEHTSKLAKWRKQWRHWHKDSARPLQLGEDAILVPWAERLFIAASPSSLMRRCAAPRAS